MGDPCGIGPEICLKAVRDKRIRQCCIPVIFGDAGILSALSARLHIPLHAAVLDDTALEYASAPERCTIVDCSSKYGRIAVKKHASTSAGGAASFSFIKAAVSYVTSGKASAVVTAPISKESLHLAGIKFPGHTEMLAALTGTHSPCMMMASSRINVSLVTTHTSYKRAAAEITTARISRMIQLTEQVMHKRLGRKPRLTVCALNPHAGENGLFGNEEAVIIKPAIKAAAAKGVNITGPLPADTAFIPEMLNKTDAYIAMYHDQGLIPFKMLSFHDGVNVTLGLPIVRTSVDHGTAFDIAYSGKASCESLVQAILMAVELC